MADARNVDSARIRDATLTRRWTALSRLDAVAADLHHFDVGLVREPRLLVPVDVQALVVRADGAETMVRLPFRDTDVLAPLDVRDPGATRPPGVHLLWSVPAALGRGRLADDPLAPGDATRRRLDLPPLPDRWVVVRLTVPLGGRDAQVRGWVVEADTATVVPLADWPSDRTRADVLGTPVPPERLTVHVGGPSWSQCYDAAQGRLALHDPLDDLGAEYEGDTLTYVVAGWWSDDTRDPLHGVGSEVAYHQRLADLGWNDPDHPAPASGRRDESRSRALIGDVFGVQVAGSYAPAASASAASAPETIGAAGTPEAAAKAVVAAHTSLAGPLQSTTLAYQPALSGFADAIGIGIASLLPPAPTRNTLLHGRVHGVPAAGPAAPDNRPPGDGLRVVLASHAPDAAATLSVAGTGMAGPDADQRRAAERLLAAFSSGLIMRLGDPDTWADVEQYEHAQSFGSLPGGAEGVDRFVSRPGPASDPGAGFRPGPMGKGRKAKVAGPGTAGKPGGLGPRMDDAAVVLWSPLERPVSQAAKVSLSGQSAAAAAVRFDDRLGAGPPTPPVEVREVTRPAPRFHRPSAPVVAVSGGGRQLSAVEHAEAAGTLVCRLADQVSRGLMGVLGADELLPTIGSGAVPPEVLGLAREALAEDPYLAGWRSRRATTKGFDAASAASRVVAEAAVSYSYYAADDSLLSRITGATVESSSTRQQAVEGLQRLSLSDGVWSHPTGVRLWGQPWRPLFCDWEVVLDLGPLQGWDLGTTDADPTVDPDAPAVTTPDPFTFAGRSPLVTGVAGTLASGVDRWLDDERKRDLGGHALADPATETALTTLRDHLSKLDLLSAALDGIRERLLGLSYDRGLLYRDTDALADGTRRALADALPRLLAAGRLRLTTARLVDAFGRTLDLPVAAALVPARVADAAPASLRLRPRLNAPARWRFDLVDPMSTEPAAALASVDQADPAKQVNPVAGFLLPDHMDEALEVFAADGAPLGQVSHDPFSDAVTWEGAPGRTDVGPAAGPTDDPDAHHHRVGWIAAGLVAADATSRQGRPQRPETESALSAMLRAIDTTLWTVDPFGSLGREHVAGLVGRPIAVVAARLSLDVLSDVDQLAYPDPDPTGLRSGRADAYAALAALELSVRLGEITRADDGLLGYFVDDDYSRFCVVDRVVAANALPSGRCKGAVATDGPPADQPVPIDHPYVDAAGVLRVHPGQTVRLTLLMHPGGKAHLTSGILPRTSRALARDWVHPGLSVLAPSLRAGPLLIDADKVRLPKVASFPVDQLFTRRDTPSSWRDDPILAATQAALLPDKAPEVQEGWVRIQPNPPAVT